MTMLTAAPEVHLPRPLPWQRQVRTEARRFNVCAVGRRAGKSTMGYELLIDPALHSYPVAWFAPTYKTLGDAWRHVREAVASVTRRSNATEHRIELLTGGVIEMWTLQDPKAGRSRRYKRAVVDEAGLVPDLSFQWNEAIRPTLADLEGDAWLLGTPNGRNFFFQVYNWGQDELRTEWKSWQMPTMVNPYIAPAEIEAMRLDMPQLSFEQEILAKFLEHSGAVFRNIPACINAPLNATPDQHRGHDLVMGVDWAQKSDFTALSVVCATCRCEVALDRFNQIGWSLQRGRLRVLYDRWQPYTVLAERNSIGSPNIEALAEEDIPVAGFDMTATSKGPLIKALVLAFERTAFQWLDVPVATGELEAYEMKQTATGHTTYSAPDSLNDDTVIARALAARAASMWGSLS